MKAMHTVPIIDELRAVRDEHAARCGHDIEIIFRDIRAKTGGLRARIRTPVGTTYDRRQKPRDVVPYGCESMSDEFDQRRIEP